MVIMKRIGIDKEKCDKCGKYRLLNPIPYSSYSFVCDERHTVIYKQFLSGMLWAEDMKI